MHLPLHRELVRQSPRTSSRSLLSQCCSALMSWKYTINYINMDNNKHRQPSQTACKFYTQPYVFAKVKIWVDIVKVRWYCSTVQGLKYFFANLNAKQHWYILKHYGLSLLIFFFFLSLDLRHRLITVKSKAACKFLLQAFILNFIKFYTWSELYKYLILQSF